MHIEVEEQRFEVLRAKFEPVLAPEELGGVAFALLDWAVDQIAQGHAICACDVRGHAVQCYDTDRLEQVKKRKGSLLTSGNNGGM